MVICLERGADLYIAQLMPLPLTVSCSSKIQIGFTFLVPAHLGSPGKRAVKRVCVCVVNCNIGSLEPVFFRCWTYFLFYILLIWGCVYAPNAPPCLQACIRLLRRTNSTIVIQDSNAVIAVSKGYVGSKTLVLHNSSVFNRGFKLT